MSLSWRAAGEQLRRAAYRSSFSRIFHTIQAVPRELTGKGVSYMDRAQGRIPGVVFGERGADGVSTRKRHISTENEQIESIFKSVHPDYFCSTTFKLEVRAGPGSSVILESGTVLPTRLERYSDTGKVRNISFLWAEEGSIVPVFVPVVIKGEKSCPGLKKGGQLNKLKPKLRIRCPAEKVLKKIVVNISKLDVGDTILLKDIKIHPPMELVAKNETEPVCQIVAATETQTETETESVEAENPVEGEKSEE